VPALRGAFASAVLALGGGAFASAVPALGGGERSVPSLLGRGPGLTPLGDDVLAGMLVTLTALGHPEAMTLRAVVLAGLGRTTFVSAALLRHAADGECVPQVAGLLGALGGDPAAVPVAAAALLAVGHSSGAGLAHGVLAGLRLAGRREVRGR